MGEALRLLVGVWLFVAGAYLVLRLLDEPTLAVWVPAVMYLGGWWKRRQLSVGVGIGAVIVGCAVGFPLVDASRERLPETAADALVGGIAMIPVVVVLVAWTRLSLARPDRQG